MDTIHINIDQGKWFKIKEDKIKNVCDKANKKHEKPPIPPVLGWKIFPSRQIPNNFNYGHIYYYLLESVVLIGEDGQKKDTGLAHMTAKPLTKGEQYVKSGSVTNMMDTVTSNGHYYLKGKVDASMRNEQRIVHVTISSVSGAVLDASCTCPASALGRCNHVAALLLMLLKHCTEIGYDAQACTSKQCEWNQGMKTNKNPCKVTEAIYNTYKPKATKVIDFDPRSTDRQNISSEKKNAFFSDLKYESLQSGKSSMWESLLSYQYEDYTINDSRVATLKCQAWIFFGNIREASAAYNSDVYMIPGTESQSQSENWRSSRWFRITASTAKQANSLGQLLTTKPTPDLTQLKSFYTYIAHNVWNLNPLKTADMRYGLENEDSARQDYMIYIQRNNPEVNVIKTGFWVNKLWPELGCSPDGLVFDPVETNKYGLVEVKCLKLFRSVAPANLFKALADKKVTNQQIYNACFGRPQSETNTLELKSTHMYYFQIQLQLAITGLEWCDFVLWSAIGQPNVERIRRDEQLIKKMTGNLTALWHRVVAPEIFEMRVPRKLYPVILQE